MNKTVLVTGCNGYIGNGITQRLLKKGYKVIGIDNDVKLNWLDEMNSISAISVPSTVERVKLLEHRFPKYTFFPIDIWKDVSELEEVFKLYNFDTIINLAQQPAAPYSQIDLNHASWTIQNNTIGCLNILWLMKKYCPNAHLIEIESMGTYKPHINVDIPEGKFSFEYNGRTSEPCIFPKEPGSYYHACYSDDTEILTEKRGFILFKELTYNDKVATLNKETDTLEYQHPSNIFSYDYVGDMISIKNRSSDLLVTPNHYVFESYSYNLPINRWKLTSAEELYEKNKNSCLYRSVSNWEGKEQDFFRLPGSRIKNGYSFNECPAVKIPMDKWLSFFGWWITEGSIYNNRVTISQDKKENFEEIVEGLEAVCINSVQTNRVREKTKSFTIKNRQLSNYLQRFGNSYTKYIPQELKELSKRHLKILFDAMMKGDGHITRNDNKFNGTYYSNSKNLINDFQEICIKLGYSTSLNKLERSESEYALYITSCRTTNLITSKIVDDKRSRDIYKKYHYNGKIYCCEVPNDIIMVRRNGKNVWCGNSKVFNTYLNDAANRWWGSKSTIINQGVVYGNYTDEIEQTNIHSHLSSDESFGTALNRFIVQAMINHPLTIYGKGNQKRGFLSLNDSVQCLELFTDNPPEDNEMRIVNQLDEIFSMNEIADKVISIAKNELNYNIEKMYIDSPRKEKTDDFYYNPHFDTLKNLGFSQTRSVEDEIKFSFNNINRDKFKYLKKLVIPNIKWD